MPADDRNIFNESVYHQKAVLEQVTSKVRYA